MIEGTITISEIITGNWVPNVSIYQINNKWRADILWNCYNSDRILDSRQYSYIDEEYNTFIQNFNTMTFLMEELQRLFSEVQLPNPIPNIENQFLNG